MVAELMVAVPGSWKSLEELEENVTLDELMNILSKSRELHYQERKFQASLHNMSLDGDEKEEDAFDRVKKRVQDRIRKEQEENSQGGYTEENDAGLMALGISVTKE